MPEETTQQKLDAILGRALRDKAFRQKLIENPAAVAEETSLSAAELEARGWRHLPRYRHARPESDHVLHREDL